MLLRRPIPHETRANRDPSPDQHRSADAQTNIILLLILLHCLHRLGPQNMGLHIHRKWASLYLLLRLTSLQRLTVLVYPGRLDLQDRHHQVSHVCSRHTIHSGASLWKEPGNRVAEETAESAAANPLVAHLKTALTLMLLPHV
jgi:hypothetical protein